MSSLVKLVDSLELKINKLLQKQDKDAQHALGLETQLKQFETQIADMQKYIDSLESKNQTLRSANAMLGSNEYKRETKLKINSLIREIDQCIVQLSE